WSTRTASLTAPGGRTSGSTNRPSQFARYIEDGRDDWVRFALAAFVWRRNNETPSPAPGNGRRPEGDFYCGTRQCKGDLLPAIDTVSNAVALFPIGRGLAYALTTRLSVSDR